jgi:hypothetical protein
VELVDQADMGLQVELVDLVARRPDHQIKVVVDLVALVVLVELVDLVELLDLGLPVALADLVVLVEVVALLVLELQQGLVDLVDTAEVVVDLTSPEELLDPVVLEPSSLNGQQQHYQPKEDKKCQSMQS